MLTERQLSEFRSMLKKRFNALREEIRLELLQSDNEHFIDLAGQVHDLEEESVADLLVDTELAVIDMHIDEIRAIDRSLMRIAHGEYGICTDCQDEIEIERLRAYSTATRCRPCQSAYEHGHVGQDRRSL